MNSKYEGQCFCHPRVENCVHCNRARAWMDQDLYVLANELGKDIDIETIENLCKPLCPKCGGQGREDHNSEGEDCLTCIYCKHEFDYDQAESECQEIMQWWIVSPWLHEHLSVLGEPVAYWKDQYWWGRTCYGQGVDQDGTFQEISRRL